MSEVMAMVMDSGRLIAKNAYGSNIWSTDDIFTDGMFDSRVESIISSKGLACEDGRVDAVKAELDGLHDTVNRVSALMAKMAKRLDEIEGGDEWDRLNRLCWGRSG